MLDKLKKIGKIVVWPLLALVGVCLLFYLHYKRRQISAAVAKLQTKIEQDSVNALRIKQDLEVTKIDGEIKVLKAASDSLLENIKNNNKELSVERANLVELEASIEKVKDWAGLDAHNTANR